MKIPLNYSFRNLWTRRLTTALTVGGVALVVFVFAAVLMLANGLHETLVSTGTEGNVIVVRKGATAELMSAVGRETASILETQPEVAMGSDSKPVSSNELVVMINMKKIGSGDMGNVTVRGVTAKGSELRAQVKLVSGRMFNFGSREVIVGNAVRERFGGTDIGDQIRFAGGLWTVVGIFDGGKTGFASEVWGDTEQLMAAFNRPVYSSMLVRLKSPSDFGALKAKIEADPRLQQVEIKDEKRYYEEQSEMMATFIRILGLVITVIFSFGAMIGAMITMYAAVANRTTEIGTLRALGFQRRSVLSAFLIESLLLGAVGGVLGLGIASLLQMITISTTNFGTFSEIAFGFALSVPIVVQTMIFAIAMGFVGGFLPSFRAARLNIITALRSS
ncbi:MAG TPA: ABC transporter permease [Bacteroidota bacterium]|nr:ABC transporter permease [Bacteroidota bacterium]